MPRPPCRCTTGNRRFGTGRANSWTEQHSRPRDLYSKKRGLIFLLDAPWLDFRLDAGLTGVASSSWKARLFIHRKRCCLQKMSTFMKTACQPQKDPGRLCQNTILRTANVSWQLDARYLFFIFFAPKQCPAPIRKICLMLDMVEEIFHEQGRLMIHNPWMLCRRIVHYQWRILDGNSLFLAPCCDGPKFKCLTTCPILRTPWRSRCCFVLSVQTPKVYRVPIPPPGVTAPKLPHRAARHWYICIYVITCVCVCVWERERERERVFVDHWSRCMTVWRTLSWTRASSNWHRTGRSGWVMTYFSMALHKMMIIAISSSDWQCI